MQHIREVSVRCELLGPGVTSADHVGVTYPNGTTQGNANSVKLRFDASFTEEAASGKLK